MTLSASYIHCFSFHSLSGCHGTRFFQRPSSTSALCLCWWRRGATGRHPQPVVKATLHLVSAKSYSECECSNIIILDQLKVNSGASSKNSWSLFMYRRAGNFQGCTFLRNGSRGPQKNFRSCNIPVSMPRNYTHHKLCMWNTGAWEF